MVFLNVCVTCYLKTGVVGIALLYLQLHRVSGDSSHLQRSLDYVKRTLRNLNGRKVTFLCGDAGPLAVAAVVHHRLNNQADSKECLTKYDINFIFFSLLYAFLSFSHHSISFCHSVYVSACLLEVGRLIIGTACWQVRTLQLSA